MMKVIRTIHPVGQGAFYSERFMDDNGNHIALVVYDCGSKDTKHLKMEILSFFSKYNTIDVLFISHFDDDHINGITQLKKLEVTINTVVIPLIDKNNKWFYVCTGGTLTRNAIYNPNLFFGTENVIQIQPVEEMPFNENEEPFLIVNKRQKSEIPSSISVSLKVLSKYWIYVPFNFQEDKRREKLIEALKNEDKFRDEAKNRKCKIEDLLHDDVFINNHYNDINKVYKKICTDGANKCSLIVYSGAIVETRASFKYYPIWWLMHPYYSFFDRSNSEGCLYLGDTDLNQGRGRGIILNHLMAALKPYINKIGIIQLPHHGAVKNYNKSLLSINGRMKLYFASFGTTNKYGHPSYNIIEHIIYNRNGFYGVSERRDSGLIEIIHT